MKAEREYPFSLITEWSFLVQEHTNRESLTLETGFGFYLLNYENLQVFAEK